MLCTDFAAALSLLNPAVFGVPMAAAEGGGEERTLEEEDPWLAYGVL
jgi:hypothetical protein